MMTTMGQETGREIMHAWVLPPPLRRLLPFAAAAAPAARSRYTHTLAAYGVCASELIR
jgi:hypothetical protein